MDVFLDMIMRFLSFYVCCGEPSVRRAFLTLPGVDLSRKAHDCITFSVGPGRHMEVRQGPVVHYFPVVASPPEDPVWIPMANRRQLWFVMYTYKRLPLCKKKWTKHASCRFSPKRRQSFSLISTICKRAFELMSVPSMPVASRTSSGLNGFTSSKPFARIGLSFSNSTHRKRRRGSKCLLSSAPPWSDRRNCTVVSAKRDL